MSLASLVDKPLIQNPLAGGGAMIRPQESQLRGDPLVEQMQMRMTQRDQKTPGFLAYFKDVMDTKGYPTKTMQEYESQFPGTTPQQVPLGANISNANFNTSPPGTLNLIDPSRAGGVGLQQAGPLQPSPPSLFPIKNEKGEDIGGIENTAIATNPIQTGALGDQGLMDRLTSLEQGIGGLQNQIASLFQMGQASDPFGLGGFINTRRY